MNENINLFKLLKGDEKEPFYCSLTGTNVVLKHKDSEFITFVEDDVVNGAYIQVLNNGGLYINGECIIFPSKDQRDWNKWAEERKPKIPKTWDELCKAEYENLGCRISMSGDYSSTNNNTPIEKSALALLKIHQLIEAGYGGNITNEEYKHPTWRYAIKYRYDGDVVIESTLRRENVSFHTKGQAVEFLSHPENVQLIKDFFRV